MPEVENHLILCGGVGKRRKKTNQNVLELGCGKEKGEGQIYLDVDAITKKMVAELPSILRDLLELATYVYVADQAISRGGTRSFDYGYSWHRCFAFTIPVREYGTWSDPKIQGLLQETLSVASGDSYSFEFIRQAGDGSARFFEFKTAIEPLHRDYDDVVLFSGGIDSVTGAIEEVVRQGRRPLLVSHQSNSKHVRLQRALCEYINAISPASPKPLHIPVKINKDKRLTKETSQRSRSFLYASLGAIVAHMFGRKRAKFYENGIVSHNLMWDGQTLQARATRSTHSHVLSLLSALVSSLLEVDFVFENPYIAKTKTEVCLRLKELHHEACIESTRSCAASVYEKDRTHCGRCSQCIDRRFATLASKCEKCDPDRLYKFNIFTDPLLKTHDRTMALGFVGFARRCSGLTRDGFVQACSSEVHQIARHLGAENAEVALNSLFLLHRRHSDSVMQVMARQIANHSLPLVKASLPDTCLIRMVGAGLHLVNGEKTQQPKEEMKKHAKGELDEEVKHLLDLHPDWNGVKIAAEIVNTTPGAVRKTKAWKQRPKH